MKTKLIEGYRLNYDEAISLLDSYSDEKLFNLANELRQHFQRKNISTCTIQNAKSGNCSEDCKWCAQSKHNKTGINTYPLVTFEDVYQSAKDSESRGVKMFGLVTSGKKISNKEAKTLSDIYRKLKTEVPNIGLCSSLGLVSKDILTTLFNAGVRRYHCNIETAPSYFAQLCTTHSIEEKIQTIKNAQEVGMSICSGGIIGMGETMQQRVEMAILLQQLNVDSIPINILQPIKETPLHNQKPLDEKEILRTIAIFKIINPKADIRLAGGRIQVKHIQEQVLSCGVSGAIVGDLLTTIGSNIEEDFNNFSRMGYSI